MNNANSRTSNAILTILLITTLLLIVWKMDEISNFLVKVLSPRPSVVINEPNAYYKNKDYKYVQQSKTFVPYSKQDIMNIFYSFLDRGYDSFTFYCPEEYLECVEDTSEIIQDQTIITDIGNFVHPYNNFNKINLHTTTSGEITLKKSSRYTEKEIKEIEQVIDNFFKKAFTDDMDLKDKILKAHDFIIDNTYYDQSENMDFTAYDLFLDGKAKCFGYADAMSIILTKLGVENIRVGSTKHVWNLAKIDDEWLHIDVTWDDPVVENNGRLTNSIRHKFYLIDTETLQSYDTDEHDINLNVYQELRKEIKDGTNK